MILKENVKCPPKALKYVPFTTRYVRLIFFIHVRFANPLENIIPAFNFVLYQTSAPIIYLQRGVLRPRRKMKTQSQDPPASDTAASHAISKKKRLRSASLSSSSQPITRRRKRKLTNLIISHLLLGQQLRREDRLHKLHEALDEIADQGPAGPRLEVDLHADVVLRAGLGLLPPVLGVVLRAGEVARVAQQDSLLGRVRAVARDERAVAVEVAALEFLDGVGVVGAVAARGGGGEGVGGHADEGGADGVVGAGLLEGGRVDLDEEFAVVVFRVLFHVDDALDRHLGFLVAAGLLGRAEDGDGAGDGGD